MSDDDDDDDDYDDNNDDDDDDGLPVQKGEVQVSEHLVMHHVTLPAPGHQSLRSDASVVVFNESLNESLKDRQDNCAGGENTDHDRALLTTTTITHHPETCCQFYLSQKATKTNHHPSHNNTTVIFVVFTTN